MTPGSVPLLRRRAQFLELLQVLRQVQAGRQADDGHRHALALVGRVLHRRRSAAPSRLLDRWSGRAGAPAAPGSRSGLAGFSDWYDQVSV